MSPLQTNPVVRINGWTLRAKSSWRETSLAHFFSGIFHRSYAPVAIKTSIITVAMLKSTGSLPLCQEKLAGKELFISRLIALRRNPRRYLGMF
jgi:hypothetical protein